MNKRNILIGLAGTAVVFAIVSMVAKSKKHEAQQQTVIYVDLKKYLGKWYDIAHYPTRFQKGCTYSTAEYKLLENGDIEVYNSCTKNGKTKDVKGKAWVVDKQTNSKLKVQFFWPFAGDYWILDIAEDYRWALVGHPQKKYMWILSRTPQLTDADKNYILSRVKFHGYDAGKLEWEQQVKS